MSISKKLKWHRSLSRLKFVHEELDYARAVGKEAAGEFEQFYRKFCAERNIDISQLDKQNRERLDELYGCNEIADDNTDDEADIDSIGDTTIAVHNKVPQKEVDEEYQMSADAIAIHESFAKLFKKIALAIHPDRIDKSLPESEIKSRVSMFGDCVNALKKRKYFVLIETAEKFKISTPKNYEPQIRWMKKESESIQKIIDNEKSTYNYAFAEAQTEEAQEALIKKFLHQVFQINID